MLRIVAILLVSLVFASVAAAQPGDDDVDALVRELEAKEGELTTLMARDCALACEALASMRRAAERICALEDGPRCDEARRKVEDATRRVREACPECAVDGPPGEPVTQPPAIPRPEAQPPPPAKKGALSDKTVEREERAVEAAESEPPLAGADAPPSEERGGCASCTVGHSGGDRAAPIWLALGLAIWALRRRR